MRIVYTKQFKKDYKKIKKRNKDLTKLKVVIEKLFAGEKLDAFYKDHKLVGQFKNY